MKLFTTLAASAVAQLNIGSLDDLFSQLNAGLPVADTEAAAADEGPVEGIGERYFAAGTPVPVTDPPNTTAPPNTDEIYGSGCWKCDEMNYVNCAVNGYFQSCAADQAAGDSGVCFIEFRESLQGLTQLCTGCKDAQACADIQKQNFAYGNPSPRNQCKSDWRFQRPSRRQYGVQQSTCRQCFSMCEPDGTTVQNGAFCFGGLGVGEDGDGATQTTANWFKPPTANFGSEAGGATVWTSVGDTTMAAGQLGIPLHTAIDASTGGDAAKLEALDNHVMFSGTGLTAATGAAGKTAVSLKPLYWALHDNQFDFWNADLVTLQRDYREAGWLANGDPATAPADQFAAFTAGVDTNLIL